MWIDAEFDVCAAALGFRQLKEGQHIQALPISYVFPGSVCIASEKSVLDIDHFDVIQGNVGDCWLLSSFQAVASSFPDIINRCVVQNDEKAGFTIFKLLDNLIKVDHFIPVIFSSDGSSEIIGPRISKQGEYWCILLEKAFIKLFSSPICPMDIFQFNMNRRFRHGICPGPSYFDINGGFPRWALSILLGVKIDPIQTKFVKDLFDIFDCGENEHFIGCAMTSCEKDDTCIDDGFVYGHAYCILKVDKQRKLFRVSNPWGIVENTKYDDNVDDGQFWVDENDFIERFPQICLAKVHTKTYWHK